MKVSNPSAYRHPRQVGGFRLQARLGASGMGRVSLGIALAIAAGIALALSLSPSPKPPAFLNVPSGTPSATAIRT